jgi:hypothetical protein
VKCHQKEKAHLTELYFPKFWPTKTVFFLLIALCALSALLFFGDFTMARSFYGIFAAMHAWIEIPLLLLLLFGLPEQPDTK